MLKKWKQNNKKGFTLVELIVVLVILAILAALLIPALTGYIDKAKEKQIVAETRQVVMAAQTLADEEYGQRELGNEGNIIFGSAGADILYTDVATLAEVKVSGGNSNGISEIKAGEVYQKNTTTGDYEVNGSASDEQKKEVRGIITYVKYIKDGKTCEYFKVGAAEAGVYIVK